MSAPVLNSSIGIVRSSPPWRRATTSAPRQHDRSPVALRVAVGDRAAERRGCAPEDRRSRSGRRHGRIERGDQVGPDDVVVPHERSHPKVAVGPFEPVEAGYPVDVDQHRRCRQADLHQRYQALSPGEHPAVFAVLGEQSRASSSVRGVVVECSRIHGSLLVPLPRAPYTRPRRHAAARRPAVPNNGSWGSGGYSLGTPVHGMPSMNTQRRRWMALRTVALQCRLVTGARANPC